MYYTLLMMCVTFSLQRRRWYFFYLVTMWHFFDFSCTITKIFATSTLYVMYTFMDALLVLHQRSMVLIVAGWAFWWMICQRICRPIAYPPDASFAHVTRCFPSLPTNHNHNYTKLEMQYSITDAIFNMKSYGLCVEEYGVAERTLRGIWMRESPPSSR